MATNQEARHAGVRALTGTSGTHEEDWIALFDTDGIAAGTFNERFLGWLNFKLSSSYPSLPQAMQAYADDAEVLNWSSINNLTISGPFSSGFSAGFE